LEEVDAGDGQKKPQAPPPPGRRAVRTASRGVAAASARAEQDVWWPQGSCPGEREQPEEWKWYRTDQVPSPGVHGGGDIHVEDRPANSEADLERETGSAHKVDHAAGRGGWRKAGPHEADGAVDQVKAKKTKGASVEEKEERSYVERERGDCL
jgi:hypothetical protein